jgi:hypothetical protein
MSMLAFWWACVEAGGECDGDPSIADGGVVLNYCANGTSALVTAGDIRQCIADAARYRWLREQTWDKSGLAVVRDPKSAVKLGYE